MEIGEVITGPAVGRCSDDSDCPFCSEEQFHGYKTKHGALKKEARLRTNLRTHREVTEEKGVGPVYPLPGGGDRTDRWEAQAGVLEDFPVQLAAAPHHLIPGKASMAPSHVESWTREEKGKIKEDIGYNIDCAQNGIFLPHLPEIYFTRHKEGTNTPMAQYYGQEWKPLSASAQESIGSLVMGETSLQMHYRDHSAPYVHVDNDMSYDLEAKQECNHLADMMRLKALKARCKDGDGKVNPPYSLVQRINHKSRELKSRITGFPRRWRSWVSPLAQDYTASLKRTDGPLHRSRGLIRKLTV
jgi:hypothetical protein